MIGRSPERILLVRLSSIGDIVLTTPLVRLLRHKFPQARIDFLTKAKFADLLRYHPGLTEVIEFPDRGGADDLRAMRRRIRVAQYDVVLDLHKNLRSLLLTAGANGTPISRLKKYGFRRFLLTKVGIDMYQEIRPVYLRYIDVAASLGVEDDGAGSELYISESVAAAVRERYPHLSIGNTKIIALAPGAGFATKRWPREYFAQLAAKIGARGALCVLLGDHRDREVAVAICAQAPACLDLTGKLSLLESAAVLRDATRLVTNDSGLLHLAEAVGTPVSAIFGSTVEALGFFPILPESVVIENSAVLCRPCSHVGRDRCPKGHFLCMRTLTPETVFTTLRADL